MSESERRWHSPSSSRVQSAGTPQSRGPFVTIIKRDGRVESFDRVKMINSIRNAGANPREANLVTNRVSDRLVYRETVPSREVSSMVARSLSHVNSTASRNYVDSRDRKLAYTARLNRLSAEIAAISQQINSETRRIESIDDLIQSLPGRITRIRQGNYRVLTHLETDQAALSEAWTRLGPELRTTANLKGEIVRTRIQDLQQALTYRLGGADYNLGNLQDIESQIPELRLNLSEMQSSVVTALSPLEKKFENIDQDLRKAESTLSILEGASFPWEEGETPVLATKAKDLNNDLEGFITLTNLRFIFEHEKEIALKKRLFVVTEKKIVREVMVQKPIGMITHLVYGKVGFFKGSGLFVEFASETGIPEMKFDTTSQDAESVTKSYNYIISGQADKELAAVAPAIAAEQEVPKLVICPICGAPYREKIYRGQTSVNCKYCGAAVSIQ